MRQTTQIKNDLFLLISKVMYMKLSYNTARIQSERLQNMIRMFNNIVWKLKSNSNVSNLILQANSVIYFDNLSSNKGNGTNNLFVEIVFKLTN